MAVRDVACDGARSPSPPTQVGPVRTASDNAATKRAPTGPSASEHELAVDRREARGDGVEFGGVTGLGRAEGVDGGGIGEHAVMTAAGAPRFHWRLRRRGSTRFCAWTFALSITPWPRRG